MNKFLNRSQPSTPKRTPAKKAVDLLTASTVQGKENSRKEETKSNTELLHEKIHDDDASSVFTILSKNRPFDASMNKTMTNIEFADTFSASSSEFMLISVDESVVKAFEEGQTLTIRGENSDDAVLCTEETTYPMKIVESATTMFIMNKILSPPPNTAEEPNFEVKYVNGKCYAVAELCPPSDILNISKLKDLLHEHELMWNWKELEDGKILGYSIPELLKSVQMSVLEIDIALQDLPVVRLSTGKLRYLSHKYRGELLECIVGAIDDDEKPEISMENVTKSALRNFLSTEHVPDEVIEWFIETRCDKIENSENYSINEVKLIRDLAVVVLFGTRKMNLRNFNELLTKILPFGITIKDSYLEGLCDVLESPTGKVVVYLAPEDLPDDSKERMAFLFNHRKLWTMEQLRPFFTDLFKSKVAFDKYLVQKCDYTLSERNEVWYCGVK